MNPDSLPAISVIIAVEDEGERLRHCISSLGSLFTQKVVVCPAKAEVEKIAREMGADYVNHDSRDPEILWQAGITLHSSPWNLLLRSNEIPTAFLKDRILEKTRSDQAVLGLFPLKHIFVFLKKRLKYPLEREGTMPSGLAYFPHGVPPSRLKGITMFPPIEGECLSYGEDTLAHLQEQCMHRIEYRADRMFADSPELIPAALFFKGIRHSLKTFFRCLLLKQAFREGFEGFVFAAVELLTTAGTYLRYYEKYRRSGRFLQRHLKTLHKILVIKTRGMGDALIATPVLKAIKFGLPEVELSVLTLNYCKPIYANNPHVDHLYGISRQPGKAELNGLIQTLNRCQFDLVLNLHAKNFSDKLARRIRARWRISNSYFQRTRASDIHVGSPEAGMSAIERDLECVRAIGLTPVDKFPELFLTEKEIQWARQYLADNGFDSNRKVVMVHPWSTLIIREWGVERFGELCRKLLREHGCQILITCDESEYSKTEIFRDYIPEVVIFKGSLRELMALIHETDLMIGNDSGPSQLSVALDTPCIVLVGNEYKNMYRDPDIFKGKFSVLYKEVPCRDALSTRCMTPVPCGNRICLDFTIEEVLSLALELMEHEGSR